MNFFRFCLLISLLVCSIASWRYDDVKKKSFGTTFHVLSGDEYPGIRNKKMMETLEGYRLESDASNVGRQGRSLTQSRQKRQGGPGFTWDIRAQPSSRQAHSWREHELNLKRAQNGVNRKIIYGTPITFKLPEIKKQENEKQFIMLLEEPGSIDEHRKFTNRKRHWLNTRTYPPLDQWFPDLMFGDAVLRKRHRPILMDIEGPSRDEGYDPELGVKRHSPIPIKKHSPIPIKKHSPISMKRHGLPYERKRFGFGFRRPLNDVGNLGLKRKRRSASHKPGEKKYIFQAFKGPSVFRTNIQSSRMLNKQKPLTGISGKHLSSLSRFGNSKYRTYGRKRKTADESETFDTDHDSSSSHEEETNDRIKRSAEAEKKSDNVKSVDQGTGTQKAEPVDCQFELCKCASTNHHSKERNEKDKHVNKNGKVDRVFWSKRLGGGQAQYPDIWPEMYRHVQKRRGRPRSSRERQYWKNLQSKQREHQKKATSGRPTDPRIFGSSHYKYDPFADF